MANEIMDMMNAVEGKDEEEKHKRRGKDEISAKGCGTIIRQTLQLQLGPRRGPGFPVYWDEMKMEALAKRYGVNIEELPPSNPTQREKTQGKAAQTGLPGLETPEAPDNFVPEKA
jgi:hypothetical protein